MQSSRCGANQYGPADRLQLPPPMPSTDAERIQAALLAKLRRNLDGWAFWLTLAACVLVFALFSGCTGPSDTQAEADTAADLRDAQQQA